MTIAENVQLSRNFWLSEAPCWTKATPAQVAKLQETAQRVLQPIRNTWGPVTITSWLWWRNECTPRTGAHAHGGTVDFVTPGADLRDVWEWGKTYLLPSGYVGRWIWEPTTATQGEHIHVAPRADMLALNGDGKILALEETPDGRYLVAMEWFDGEAGAGITGTYLDPFQVEGITAYGTRRAGLSWALGLGLLAAAARP